jgi:hypothetical protein
MKRIDWDKVLKRSVVPAGLAGAAMCCLGIMLYSQIMGYPITVYASIFSGACCVYAAVRWFQGGKPW